MRPLCDRIVAARVRSQNAACAGPEQRRARHLLTQQRHGDPLAGLLPFRRQLLPRTAQELIRAPLVLAVLDEVIPQPSRNQRNSLRQILRKGRCS